MAEARPNAAALWSVLDEIPDPEIPVISIVELGIVRDARVDESGVEVDVAPTYSGCPATEVIENTVRETLEGRGYDPVRVRRVLSPAWTTDFISDRGRQKLLDYGIAPPAGRAGKRSVFAEDKPAACPRCGSTETTRVSEFGSTPCKASWRCDRCFEPFEYFKCL
jgi:ring-1,2-phenylacetyl-CoA epoxidase subunit PaaD